ncbi:MAG: MBL fold metallo-hydrolase, partial [Taibaiella sp.]|nr:MBL fold metallo-hydrolase [Taibaiella sp.]
RSLGGRLKKHPAEVTIFGRPFPVRAEIDEITSLSAHGDYEDLSQWLSCQDISEVKSIFLVHGEYEVQEKFSQRLLRKGFNNVEIPSLHSEFPL